MQNYRNCQMCEDCILLGQSTHTNQCIPVFFTISPDPEKDDYNEKLPNQQKKWLLKNFRESVKEINTKIKILGISSHFELNQSANLHIHGIIYISDIYAGCELPLALMMKILHRRFGRKFNRCSVSCKVEHIYDIDLICSYVNKENIFPPLHDYCQTPDISKWLLPTCNDCQGVNNL